MITAPFNFVPLSDKVFFPDWAEDVSHDIPFEDGESGCIDITITAKSPMFIRNHSNDKANPSTEFCNHNGEYYIPSTSVKGMVRNVLEIMSFSKMSQFDDDTYAFRDLNNKIDYMSQMTPTNTFCGWLKKSKDGYIIEDCGLPGRIRLDKIDEICSSKFSENFNEKDDDKKTAKFKYDLFSNIELPTTFTYQKNHNGRDVYAKGGTKKGTVVFTGQPSKRKEGEKPKGKIYEFVFFEPEVKKEIIIDSSTFDNFKFAYFDNKSTQSKDWKFWKMKLDNDKKVPVFFQKDMRENVEVLKHFGLSYLYKLPYSYSISDAIKSASTKHICPNLDLTQTILGYVDTESKKALKGRIQFSHFKVDTIPEKFDEITTVLGSPRASYYPIYMKQTQTDGDYNTLMGKDTVISGRKRYSLHHNKPNPKKYNEDEKSATTFQALGTYDSENKFKEFTFSGKLRYHNLKEVELGAILSALTFHGNEDNFYHSIGMAKSLGFGKISINIDLDNDKLKDRLGKYEFSISLEIDNWLETEQLTELFSMADKDINIDEHLKYLLLDPTIPIDEFRTKKSNREVLPLVSNISNVQNKLKSFLSIQQKKDLEIKKEDKLKENRQEEIENLLNNTPSSNSEEYHNAIKNFIIPKAIGLLKDWYDYEDLSLLLNGKEESIKSDMKYDSYMQLTENKKFLDIEAKLIKRDKNEATDLELAELYHILIM